MYNLGYFQLSIVYFLETFKWSWKLLFYNVSNYPKIHSFESFWITIILLISDNSCICFNTSTLLPYFKVNSISLMHNIIATVYHQLQNNIATIYTSLQINIAAISYGYRQSNFTFNNKTIFLQLHLPQCYCNTPWVLFY